MTITDFIAIALIVAVIIATIVYFIIKNNEKRSRIVSILKSHPVLSMVLLDCENVPVVSTVTDEQSNKLLSLSDGEWEEWEILTVKVKNLADKYPHTLYDFISESFPKCKDRLNYKKEIELFTPIPQRVKIAVASLFLDELRQIDADSENVWKERDTFRVIATKIRQKYPDGFNTYCDIHKEESPQDRVIVNDKKHIAELQKLYDESKSYEGWEKKQEKFSSVFWQILEDIRSQDGRYTYDVSFNKPTRNGTLVESRFKVWQGFCESFSACLLDKQTETFLQRYNEIEKFKNHSVYFKDSVYENIFSIINRFNDKIKGNLYVFFVNKCSFDFPDNAYDYHYKHLRELIDHSEINWYNLSELPLVNDNGKIGGVFVFDFITSNEDLRCNCKFIIEHFRLSVPYIGYYSMEKEYDEQELLELAKKKDGYLNFEERDIKYIKKCLLKIHKHSFFSYLAIPNTWVGEARDSEGVKERWLDNPTKYNFKTKDEAGRISGVYSIDGGLSYEDISIEGDVFDVDDTAKFTYLLFKNMGILSQFKKKGKKVVDYMNEQGMLAYH